jgi:CDP-6-deoxy-D-xylo-4-hexulose-3-dehydrase
MLITDNKALYETALVLRAHGWIRDLPDDNTIYPKTGNQFEESWKFVLPGYNLRPSEINGALGSIQLTKLDGFIRQRRKNAEHYIKLFKDADYCKIVRPPSGSSWFGFPFILTGDLKGKRAEVMDIFNQYHIDTRPIVSGNFINNPVIKELNCTYKTEFVNAEEIDKDGFVVGNSHANLEAELTYLKDIFEKARRAIND